MTVEMVLREITENSSPKGAYLFVLSVNTVIARFTYLFFNYRNVVSMDTFLYKSLKQQQNNADERK